jgi:hypothetical protein
MGIANELFQIGFLLTHHGVVPILEQMPVPSVPSIEIHRITSQAPPYGCGQRQKPHKSAWTSSACCTNVPFYVPFYTVLPISQSREDGLKYCAFSACFHLLAPASLHLSMAYRTIDKPAKAPTLKFPRRALLPRFPRAPLNDPAGLMLPIVSPPHGQEKQHLSFNMHRNPPPSLLEALYRLKRGAQQLCHLSLGLCQLASDMRKLLSVH